MSDTQTPEHARNTKAESFPAPEAMTRFLYIADTHLGADPMGYQQQRGYPEHFGQVLAALSDYIKADTGIDFVLHGGDMIDATTDDGIRAALDAFDLAVPVYLCLGNHDLTTSDAVDRWLTLATRFFPGGNPDYTIDTGHCVIHVAPNHWCDVPLYWHGRQDTHLSADQIDRLSRGLEVRPDVPHLLLTHSPVYGLPPEQTGFPAPCHCSNPSFVAQVTSLASNHGSLACILGAHNHMNMRATRHGVEFVTVSALVETPFEFKCFEASTRSLRMATVALAPALDFGAAYDATKAFVQGRSVDRSFGYDGGRPDACSQR